MGLFKNLFRKNYRHTRKFLNQAYPVNNIYSKKIEVGDTVIVHPTATSISREPFEAMIKKRYVNWVGGGCKELCTYVEGKHGAVINDYLFNRLEFKKR